ALARGVGAEEVILGDEQMEEYLPLLEGKRVAIFANQSAIVGDDYEGDRILAEGEDQSLLPFGKDKEGNDLVAGDHLLYALCEKGVNVSLLFSPEHGFAGRASAGESISSEVEERTGVPIVSLYGERTIPLPEEMDLFDVLVADIQDVGLRFYTYYMTLYDLMDMCAQYGKQVIILDRPNPNGFYVDGPILEDAFISGVGRLPIPVVHGMTLGELSQMMNQEGWFSQGAGALSLTVIPCRNYDHQTKYSLYCPPSPNLKDMRAVYLYASMCYFENTEASLGRGTTFPFEVFGSPAFASLEEFDFSFTPESREGALNPPFEGETCYGRDLRNIPIEEIWEKGIDLSYLIEAYQAYQRVQGEGSFFARLYGGTYWIDNLFGTDRVRRMIEEGHTAEEVEASWQDEVEAFKEARRPYLLYAE
ncbi:MAG: DUF1343 domain-containing protein, partial [Blautia sp.]|nr:DUF1343 domain-containing protein [Blautia sp.]